MHHERGVRLEIGEEVLDGELVVLGYVHLAEFTHLEQFLLGGQHLTDEVFRDHPVRREVPLSCAIG